MKHIVSFSGGKDSTAMVLKMIEHNYAIDELVYFDCGWEWPQVQQTVQDVAAYTGLPLTVVRPEQSFEWWMYEKPCAIGLGKGWPRFNLRWCTGLKQDTIRKYLKDKKPYLNYIGITADEASWRLNKPKSNYRYPLVELGITEKECLQICYKHGFTWDGLYNYMDSTSCWCCPLQPLRSLKNLYINFPDLWEKLTQMAARTPTPFKIKGGGKIEGRGIFIPELEARFKAEIEKEKGQTKLPAL